MKAVPFSVRCPAALGGRTSGASVLPSESDPTAAFQSVPSDSQPVGLPGDDGPHQRLTEWWYYTGHLIDDGGRRYGFEFVIFRAERGDFPVSWASHLAVTDETRETFHYGERIEVGPQVDRSPRDEAGVPTGFELVVSGTNLVYQLTFQLRQCVI